LECDATAGRRTAREAKELLAVVGTALEVQTTDTARLEITRCVVAPLLYTQLLVAEDKKVLVFHNSTLPLLHPQHLGGLVLHAEEKG
jgi:hypothetical protein